MPLRFVTRKIHACLDYPVALGLFIMPMLLDLGESNPTAFWLSVTAGIAAFALTLTTDHHLGVLRILPYRVHLAVDLAVGLVFLAAPSAFGFAALDAVYYWLIGAAVVTVIALHKPETTRAFA